MPSALFLFANRPTNSMRMKKPLHLLALLILSFSIKAQVTTPVIKANFGVDAELRANYFDGFLQSGNDDWFAIGATTPGQSVIDTNGAASLINRYNADPSFRRLPFFRTMRVPQMSIINNRLWIDAVYIRDYNGLTGDDSTAFVMSNKNGDSPADWIGGSTPVLAKNDIADMMVHVRRAGPSKTDELWFMGGVSLQGTTGNRFFDFELYQTDIFYTRSTGKFTNYGPDAGHTSWKIDASGAITAPGDVIFTAEYSSSSLTFIEARIWVHRSALSITPAAFDWGGDFVGATNSAEYGYANIRPKTAGDYYTGMQSANNTWAGPFGFIDGANNLLTTYSARQFMEFSVNLTKLGLDPITLLGGSACGLPFRRILVKTRSSTSFSSELKDFIGPFDFFKTAPVEAVADVPLYCGVMGVSNIKVMNPLPASVYTWSTPNGRIFGDTVGTSITVDTTGVYVVSQQLLDGCSSSSTDTVLIVFDSTCTTLNTGLTDLKGTISYGKSRLSWTTTENAETQYFDIQRSVDGRTFQTVGRTMVQSPEISKASYGYADDVSVLPSRTIYYRLRVQHNNGKVTYSNVVKVSKAERQTEVLLFPSPATQYVTISVPVTHRTEVKAEVLDIAGKPLYRSTQWLQAGDNLITVDDVAHWPSGVYLLRLTMGGETQWKKFVVNTSTRTR